jgi:hypothetical protein
MRVRTNDTTDDVEDFESQSSLMYSIPLVIDTNNKVLRELRDSVKFFKDFPLPVKASTKKVTEEPPSSDQEAAHSTQVTSHPTQGSLDTTLRASRPTHVASRPTQVASRPTHVASRPTQVASRPTQVASRPTHVASRPTQVASRPTRVASRPTQVASRPTQVAQRSNRRAPHSNHSAPRSNHRAPRSNQDARQSRQEASCLPQPTNWEVHQGLPPSSPPPTPSTIFSSPPVSCPSSPGTPVLVSSYVHDSVHPPTSRYERSRYERPRYEGQRQCGGVRGGDGRPLPYDSDTRKRTRDDYETAREASDLENETVVERYQARLEDN